LADKVKTDRDYLFLSAMVKSRETGMLTREKMDRILDAATVSESGKLLAECGYEDMSGMNSTQVDAALEKRRAEVFRELSLLTPEKEVVDLFRAKYDYHNAKVVIKAQGAQVDGTHLLSGCGRVAPQAVVDAFNEEDYRFIPAMLGKAMAEARGILARTGNPQLADLELDRAYFSELTAMADKVGSTYPKAYVKLLIDSANLRTAVRTMRMHKDQEFLRSALIPGGDIGVDRLAHAAISGDGLTSVFNATPLEHAAVLGAEAVDDGSLTAFELACDNAVNAFLSKAKFKGFGPETVLGYLAGVETDLTAARMIMTGKLAGLSPDKIRERLRDCYA
jgi:V/A-type H+-transporting ATPase subunit C